MEGLCVGSLWAKVSAELFVELGKECLTSSKSPFPCIDDSGCNDLLQVVRISVTYVSELGADN